MTHFFVLFVFPVIVNSDPEERLDPLLFIQPSSQLVLRWMHAPGRDVARSVGLPLACREFYLLLKQSLLELPPLTSAQGGLWLATRGPMANLVRVLRMSRRTVSAADLNERMPLSLLRELCLSGGQEPEDVESLLAMFRPFVRSPHKLVATFAE